MSGLSALDRHFPPCGPCRICGSPDARHWLLDAIRSRHAAVVAVLRAKGRRA